MNLSYNIEGMTCGGCIESVQQGLDTIPEVLHAELQLSSPQAILTLSKNIPSERLNKAIGKYKITEIQELPLTEEKVEISIETYKPLIIIVTFILGVTILVQFPFQEFDTMLLMRHFMAGFFIVFSFFKFLNLKGFASSYSMYDIISGRWYQWGYIYPFVELGLGILYLTNTLNFWTNVTTIIVLGISSIGVIKSNLNNQKIKCACLGDVFNLPMSTVTIIEDLSMVIMAGFMLIL